MERTIRPDGSRREPTRAPRLAAPSRFTLFMRRVLVRLSEPPLRRLGVVMFISLIAGTGAYGAVRGGHVDSFNAAMLEAGDAVARGFGFGIVQAEVSGTRFVSREEILRRAGVTEMTSLLLLDADGVRTELLRETRIAEARVRKFYPDRLEIVIEEREAFARWQRNGEVFLIARDGAVLESDIGGKAIDLPLVVGAGADKRAAALIDLLDRFPRVKTAMRAGILVAERRWNLRLKNGIDVRLPEEDSALALERLVQLDESRQIMTRDLTAIDLRVPGRVTVSLTDEAAAAVKQKAPKRPGAES